MSKKVRSRGRTNVVEIVAVGKVAVVVEVEMRLKVFATKSLMVTVNNRRREVKETVVEVHETKCLLGV